MRSKLDSFTATGPEDAALVEQHEKLVGDIRELRARRDLLDDQLRPLDEERRRVENAIAAARHPMKVGQVWRTTNAAPTLFLVTRVYMDWYGNPEALGLPLVADGSRVSRARGSSQRLWWSADAPEAWVNTGRTMEVPA